MPHIYVDATETDLFEALSKKKRLTVEKTQLKLFDVLIGTKKGTVGIEIKRADDFFQSMDDGRLKDQLDRMQAMTDHICVILVEGDLNAAMAKLNRYKRVKYTYPQLWGMRWSIIYNYDVHILATKDATDTVGQIEYIALKDDISLKKGAVRKLRKGRRFKNFNDRLQYALEGITGASNAVRLLKKYGTVFQSVKAIALKPSEVQSIPNIGKKSIDSWTKILKTKYKQKSRKSRKR
jgi:ERCC4-type nuclease